MTPKESITHLVPPILITGYLKICNRLTGRGLYLSGNYTSWEEARKASTGYDADLILEKTKNALLKVKRGEAIYERDSVLFNEIQYSWPLLAGLMWVAALFQGRLNVLDFGGSLGSTYYQNRAFLRNLPEIRWNIIEQTAHVKAGKEFFEDDVLKFFPDLETCLSETEPNVILMSGVLQFLDKPFDILKKLLNQPVDYVIIDRIPFLSGSEDRLCVQHVPSSIYPASYPAWILSEEIFLHNIQKNKFEVIAEIPGFDIINAPVHVIWKGVILRRKKTI